MSIRYLKKIDQNRRKKAGISPVVATVILVAVAVVIAAALAGFAGSLFGSYSNGPQIKVVSMQLDKDGVIGMTMGNSGNAADAVIKVSINGYGDTGAIAAADGAIPANTNPVVLGGAGGNIALTDAGASTTGGADLAEGQQVTAIVSLQSGATVTQTLTVVDALT